jgi:hypothetical protein
MSPGFRPTALQEKGTGQSWLLTAYQEQGTGRVLLQTTLQEHGTDLSDFRDKE